MVVSRKWLRDFVILLFLLLISTALSVRASETGKISGTVLDKKTNEGLPGVRVFVMGTTLGALTDLDGRFLVVSVPAGVHTVRATYVGYTDVETDNVRVTPDSTIHLSFELEQALIKFPKHLFDNRPFLIRTDEALSRSDISRMDVPNLPVTTVADILRTQVGVKVRDGKYHIRGGRTDEFLYIVDGVTMNDPLGGRGPADALILSASEIERLSVLRGVVPAEYGEATSGIVEVTTRDHYNSRTRIHLAYYTDNLGSASLNTFSNDFNRCEFVMGGSEFPFSEHILPALGLGRPSSRLNYLISADFDRTNTYTPIDAFNTSQTRMDFRSTKFLGMDIRDRQENYGNVGVKFTYRSDPRLRIKGVFRRSRARSLVWDWKYRYTANTMPWIEDGHDLYSVQWIHNLDPNTLYTVRLSRFTRTYEEMPGDPNVAGGLMNPDGFLFADEADHYADANQNGQYDPPESWIDQYADGQYNEGDIWEDHDGDGRYNAGMDALIYDFNGNGRYDAAGGEPFADRNGNHVWDDGDPITQDGNGNGTYDPARERDMFGPSSNDLAEPFIDGDRSHGEPFVDINKNGRWDADYPYPLGGMGEPFTDLSGDSKYQGPDDAWVPGIPYDDLNGNGIYDQGTAVPSGSYSTQFGDYDIGEPYSDLNGNGRLDPGDGFYDRGWDKDVLWHRHRVRALTVDGDLTHQAGQHHELKGGFMYTAYDLTMEEVIQGYKTYRGLADDGPYPGRGIRRDFYTQTPKAGAVYLRDKLQYGSLNANVGLRYDYFIQSDNAAVDVTDAGYIDAWGNVSLYGETRHELAPRLLFWFPITHYAKVFFNYGQFYRMPQYAYMYRRSTSTSSEDYAFGNVNLEYEKTIQYEIGLETELWWDYLLSVQGYYKDDFGRAGLAVLPGWASYDGFTYYVNVNDARSRGVEIELQKRYGRYTSWSVAYDYAHVTGRETGGSRDLFGNIAGWDYIEAVQELPLDWDQRHAVTLTVNFLVPHGNHPRFFGLYWPDAFGVNVLWRYGSGYPYSPGAQHPGASLQPGGLVEPNSLRLPASSTVDVRFNKDFRLGRAEYTFQVWVMNLFDRRNVLYVSPQTGRPETGLNLGGIPYLGSIEADPRNWGPGRQVRVGVGVDF